MEIYHGALTLYFLVVFACAQEGRPFGGHPKRIPETIQAEDFDEGGEGVGFHKLTKSDGVNTYRPGQAIDIVPATWDGGGFSVAELKPGEWLSYTVNVRKSGKYEIYSRVCNQAKTGGTFHFEFNGKDLSGPVVAPFVERWDNYGKVTCSVELTSGVQTMRVVMDKAGDSPSIGKFNWFNIASPRTNVDDVIDMAWQLKGAKREKEALALLENAIQRAQGNPDGVATYKWRQAWIQQDLYQFKEALDAYAEALALSKDPDLRFHLFNGQANAWIGIDRYDMAVESFEAALKEFDKSVYPDYVFSFRKRIGECLLNNLDQLEKAKSTFEGIAQEYSNDPAARMEAQFNIAKCMGRQADYSGEAQALEALLKGPIAQVGIGKYMEIQRALAESYFSAKKYPEALKAYEELLKRGAQAQNNSELLKNMAAVHVALKDYRSAIGVLRDILARYPLQTNQCADVQKMLVEIHLEGKDEKKALAAALRFYCAANSTDAVEEANKCICRVLRGNGTSVVKATAFLKYQMQGPAGPDQKLNTADDLENPVAAALKGAMAPDSDEQKLVDSALQSFSKDRRSRAYLFLHFGVPLRAMPEFKAILQACAVDDKDFKTAVNDVATCLKAINGHPLAGPVFVEYLMYGAKGKDGKSNLSDPLKDY